MDILSLAKKHSITRDVASPDFFEGAVMGNGGLGLVVCTRPDALVLHLGHNSIWDIRLAEDHKGKVGTFDEIWGRVLADKDHFPERDWFRAYHQTVTKSYHDYSYPRPWPASSVYLFFDRKEYEVLGHTLDLSDGLLTVALETADGKKRFVKVAVAMDRDAVVCRAEDENGSETPLFDRMRIIPRQPDEGIPAYETLTKGFRQLLPANGFDGAARPGKDRGFSVLYETDGTVSGEGIDVRLAKAGEISVQVTQGYYTDVARTDETARLAFAEVYQKNQAVWRDYWQRSGVQLSDEFLERIWYRNIYFLRCVLSESSQAPGLFGNWMHGDIGTAWHGDYHMNYNTQQPFWGLMAANRQDLHLPYLRMAESFLPVSEAWAKDFYGLPGACFPHSAYPVEMTVNPYPAPDWGWEILETPWTVQSLWWHYTYTKDLALLRERIWPLLRAAVAFLAAYMTREGADPVGDGKYHLFPTIVPELYGLAAGLEKNLDGAVDLTLTKFVFRAFLRATQDLGMEREEQELTDTVSRILAAYPDYPTAEGRFGRVYVSVGTEDPDRVIYNCPANLAQVFPGEDVDAQTADAETLALAENSWRHHYNEGGNDLVFYHLIGARLGILDLEKFKRHVRYSLLPNGTAFDRTTLAGGRYPDDMDTDFMRRMGVWVENLSLHAVVNECLLWGHTDTLVLFPNWDPATPAAFRSLRTKGAFLVDAACENGEVAYARVTAEAGGTVRLKNPWLRAVDGSGTVYEDEVIRVPLAAGERLCLKKAAD